MFADLEALVAENRDASVTSEYDHDAKERVYILNPDAAEVERVQRREVAVQLLLAAARPEF